MKSLNLIGAAVAASMAMASAASAENFQIHTGSTSGAYFGKIAPAAVELLGGNPPQEARDAGIIEPGLEFYYNIEITTSKGTAENIERVLANPLDVGVGQGDLVYGTDGIVAIATGVRECLYIVTKPNSGITSIGDIPLRAPFAVPAVGSGSEATWRTVAPLLGANLRGVANVDGGASGVINAVRRGAAVAGFFVQIADTANDAFQQADDADLVFLPVVSRGLARYQSGGVRPYTIARDLKVQPGGFIEKVQRVNTACTDVVIFMQDPVAAGLSGIDLQDRQDMIAALQKAATAGLLIPKVGGWTDLFGKWSEMAGDEVDALFQ